MRRFSYVIAACMAMAACSNERLYQILGSPDPQGPPTIYPLNFPICPPNWGKVVVPLQIVVYSSGFPNPEYAVELMKRHPDKDLCDVIRERYDRPQFRIERRDHWKGVGGLDKSGHGYSSSTHYHFNLMNDETLRDNERKQRVYEEFQTRDLIRYGHARKEFIDSEETLMINGMEWSHQVIGKYTVTSFDPNHPREANNLEDLSDIYEHRFDESHVFQIKGQYNKIILAHPELLKDRRRMTRRLVEGFRYEFLTPEQIELIDGPRG